MSRNITTTTALLRWLAQLDPASPEVRDANHTEILALVAAAARIELAAIERERWA